MKVKVLPVGWWTYWRCDGGEIARVPCPALLVDADGYAHFSVEECGVLVSVDENGRRGFLGVTGPGEKVVKSQRKLQRIYAGNDGF